MLHRLLRIGAWAGLATLALTHGVAWLLTATLAREVIYLAPHAPEVVELNQLAWTRGEPVAPIYGIPAERPIRVLFARPEQLLIPTEDPRLTLLVVNKQRGDNPLQEQTVWYFAHWIAAGGALFGLICAVTGRLRRRPG